MKKPITEVQFRDYVRQMRILQRFADYTKDPKDRRQSRPYEKLIDEYLGLDVIMPPCGEHNKNKEK